MQFKKQKKIMDNFAEESSVDKFVRSRSTQKTLEKRQKELSELVQRNAEMLQQLKSLVQ